MYLHELLRADRIKVGLEAEKKREAISELIDHLVQQHDIALKLRDPLLDAVLENEGRAGSGVEDGVAVPHCHTERVEDLICALGISKAGVPFDTLDGEPARIVVLVLAPKRQEEIHALAGIQHLLENAALRDELRNAASPEAAYEAIRNAELAMVS